ncbi:30S ribosomal protein S16, partial [Bacteroidota bacterium]
MPVRIRLARHGRKARPFYHIVVADGRAPRDGKFIEKIGSFNPIINPPDVVLDFDKALSWLQKGAQPSDTCRNILSEHGVLLKNHLLKGVLKGALTEEQAEAKFKAWLEEKKVKIEAEKGRVSAEIQKTQKERKEIESKIREEKEAELKKKRAQLVEEIRKESEPETTLAE